MWIRSFSLAMEFIASATALLETSRTTSTPSRSNHCRAIWLPTSALFWWSPTSNSTAKPRAAGSNSSIAWRTQATEVAPVTLL